MVSFIKLPITCSYLVPFQIVQCRKHSLQNAFRQTYQFKILIQRNTFFSSKKGKAGKKRFKLYLADTKFDVASTLWRYMNVELM